MAYTDYLGQLVAGTGAAISNIAGYPVRIGGGEGLGARIAGQSQPYFEGVYSPNVISPLAQNPYIDPASQAGYQQTLVEQGLAPGPGNVQGIQTQPQGGGGGQPAGPGEAEVNKLLRIMQEGQLNPAQRSQLEEMLKSMGPSEADINAIYGPGMEALSRAEQSYRSELPLYQQQIEAETAAGLEQMGTQEAEAKRALGKQEEQVTQSQTNALQQARQLYNELAQRYGALFGSRTSAGPFAMEMLGRGVQQQFGTIAQTAGQGVQAVRDELNKLGRWVDTQKNEWGRKKQAAQNNLTLSFQNTLRQINSQRAGLESEKAAKRYDALVAARNQAAQIEAADLAFSRQLALFQAEKQTQLQNAFAPSDVTSGTIGALGAAWQPSVAATTGGAQAQPQYTSYEDWWKRNVK